MNFSKPNLNNFPLVSVLNLLPEKETYFETILITINDNLVKKYLAGDINYVSIEKNILNLNYKKCPFLTEIILNINVM